MKTTVEIPDPLFNEAKAVATSERSTLRSLIEEGLRWVLEKRRKRGKFKLRDASVGGKGLQPGIQQGSWEEIRGMIYRGRGT